MNELFNSVILHCMLEGEDNQSTNIVFLFMWAFGNKDTECTDDAELINGYSLNSELVVETYESKWSDQRNCKEKIVSMRRLLK